MQAEAIKKKILNQHVKSVTIFNLKSKHFTLTKTTMTNFNFPTQKPEMLPPNLNIVGCPFRGFARAK